jgi:putative DNA primase/helicase
MGSGDDALETLLSSTGTADKASQPKEENLMPRKDAKSSGNSPVLNRKKPVEIAGSFVESFGVKRLMRWRGDFYQWQMSAYQKLEDDEIRTALYSFLHAARTEITVQEHDPNDPSKMIDKTVLVAFNPDDRIVNKVVDALEHCAHIRIRSNLEAPCWLPHVDKATREKHRATDLFACKSGLVNLVTGEKVGYHPGFFNLTAADFDYDPKAEAKCERWEKFLDEILPDDTEAQETIEEMMAYTLTADRSYQKIFLLVGPPRAGKGTIIRVQTALLGASNVKSPTCASLGEPFGLAPLIGMKAAVIPDARLEGRGTHALVERLLSISGQDALSVNRKGKIHWDGTLGTQLWMLSNTFPGFSDASAVIASRFIPVWFRQSFHGNEDPALTDTLLGELPGILKRLMDALERLRERGKFRIPASAKQVVEIMEDAASPIRAFVRECCDLVPGFGELCDEVHPAYAQWCKENGTRARGKSPFRQGLMEAAHSVNVRRRGGRGEQEWTCDGLKLNDRGRELMAMSDEKLEAQARLMREAGRRVP